MGGDRTGLTDGVLLEDCKGVLNGTNEYPPFKNELVAESLVGRGVSTCDVIQSCVVLKEVHISWCSAFAPMNIMCYCQGLEASCIRFGTM